MSWQDRAREELQQLVDRLEKLLVFTDTPEFEALPSGTQALLLVQMHHMTHYGQALKDRLRYDG